MLFPLRRFREMPVDPFHIRAGRIGRIIEYGNFPADERLPAVSPGRIAGNRRPRLIQDAADRVLHAGMVQGYRIVVTVQMRVPDDLHDPARGQPGRPPACSPAKRQP